MPQTRVHVEINNNETEMFDRHPEIEAAVLASANSERLTAGGSLSHVIDSLRHAFLVGENTMTRFLPCVLTLLSTATGFADEVTVLTPPVGEKAYQIAGRGVRGPLGKGHRPASGTPAGGDRPEGPAGRRRGSHRLRCRQSAGPPVDPRRGARRPGPPVRRRQLPHARRAASGARAGDPRRRQRAVHDLRRVRLLPPTGWRGVLLGRRPDSPARYDRAGRARRAPASRISTTAACATSHTAACTASRPSTGIWTTGNARSIGC